MTRTQRRAPTLPVPTTAPYEVDAVTFHGTVAILFAHDTAGHEVAIACEPRMAARIDRAVFTGRRPVVDVEPGAILYAEPGKGAATT
jgi:hypothetical protein